MKISSLGEEKIHQSNFRENPFFNGCNAKKGGAIHEFT